MSKSVFQAMLALFKVFLLMVQSGKWGKGD